jgi:hypothetical protein
VQSFSGARAKNKEYETNLDIIWKKERGGMNLFLVT